MNMKNRLKNLFFTVRQATKTATSINKLKNDKQIKIIAMNKLSYFLSIVLVIIVLIGCQKFLDKQPKDTIARSDFFKSAADYERSITFTYNTLQNLYSGSGHYYWGWSGEEGYGNRSSFSSTPSTYNQSAAFSHYQIVWTYLYTGIREANNLLDAIEKRTVKISDSVANKYKGEALFLRGYYYFMLVQLYGRKWLNDSCYFISG